MHWDGTAEEEEQIKEETKATIRCIPLDAEEEQGISLITGKPSNKRVLCKGLLRFSRRRLISHHIF